MSNINIVFFGSSKFSVFCLDELKKQNTLPILIVTTPDKPKGRKLILTKTEVKLWAKENSIPCLSPEILDTDFIESLQKYQNSVFLVASYGKILPLEIINIPQFKTLNIHPSLLPKYRGASPLQSQILNNETDVGVSLMLMDEKMDHGPIIDQKIISLPTENSYIKWPKLEEFKKLTAMTGIKIFLENLEPWTKNQITPVPQNHEQATFTKKIKKEDGLLDLQADAYTNFRRIQAYSMWPQAYFFIKHKGVSIRIIIKEAEFSNGELKILKVLPEGKKEMLYTDFVRGLKTG